MAVILVPSEDVGFVEKLLTEVEEKDADIFVQQDLDEKMAMKIFQKCKNSKMMIFSEKFVSDWQNFLNGLWEISQKFSNGIVVLKLKKEKL